MSSRGDDFEIVHLNDIAGPELIAYLFEYDSVFGVFGGDVQHDNTSLTIKDLTIPMTSVPDMSDMDLSNVDVFLDCTGKSNSRTWAERGLRAGARRVVISGPCPSADLTLVLGANDSDLGDQPIISCASCTTNALAPLLRRLDDGFGLISGHMTTIHCYTGSQPTVDAPRGDKVRSRAAARSMIPTTTSAAGLTDLVLPDLAGRVTSHSVRVPSASVSAVDLVVRLEKHADVATLNNAIDMQSDNIIGTTVDPLVSSDLRGRPESLILALPETSVNDGLTRVFGWYDNEWGFSNRMLDVVERL